MAEETHKYSTIEEESAITEKMVAKGFRLKESQNYKDGKFLIFTDVPVVKTLSERVDDLEARVARLEGA